MDLKNRIRKLQEEAAAKVVERRRIAHRRCLQNATFEEVLNMVEEAILPESRPVFDDLLHLIDEYHQRPPRQPPFGDGKTQDVHGFVEWLEMLQAGSAALPETIPHSVILAWRNGTVNHPAKAAPIAEVRCAACWMALPGCTAEGTFHISGGGFITPCPCCGNDRMAYRNCARDIMGPEAFYPASKR